MKRRKYQRIKNNFTTILNNDPNFSNFATRIHQFEKLKLDFNEILIKNRLENYLLKTKLEVNLNSEEPNNINKIIKNKNVLKVIVPNAQYYNKLIAYKSIFITQFAQKNWVFEAIEIKIQPPNNNQYVGANNNNTYSSQPRKIIPADKIKHFIKLQASFEKGSNMYIILERLIKNNS